MAQIGPGGYKALLGRLGAPTTPQTLRFFNAWQRAEGGNATYNPFNTTQPYAGASSYNSVGVRNYPTIDAGVDATARTITNGRYQPLVRDLRRGADALTLARDVEASPWGTGGGVLRVLGSAGAAPVASAPPAPAPAAARPAAAQGDWATALRGGRSSWVSALRSPTTTAPSQAGSWVAALTGTRAARPTPVAAPAPSPASQPGPLPLAQPRTVTQPPGSYRYIKPRDSSVTLQGVDPNLLSAVNAFGQAIGQPVIVTSGHRDRAEQAALYKRYLAGGNIAAKPGRSNHEFGKALDITVGGQSVGLTRYAKLLGKYGLHLSVPGDYPHVTLASVNG